MLNIIRIITVILGGMSLVICLLEFYGFIKIKNKIALGIVCFTLIICAILFEIDDIISFFTGW